MVSNGFGNEKSIQSVLARLETATKCGDIGFFTSKYERKHAKAHWIGLHSTKNALVIHLIFRVLLQKSKKNQILKKK